MKCVAFKKLERGSLQGFADIAMDSGLVLLGCSLHQSNGKRWCNPPGRPQLDADRKPLIDGKGKLAYAPVVEFVEPKLRYKWSAAAVAAIEAYQSTTPAEAGAMNGRNPVSGEARGRDG